MKGTWAAAQTLREVADSPSTSEQIPDKQQGVRQGGEAGRGPDYNVPEQVDLRLWEGGRLVWRGAGAGAAHPWPSRPGRTCDGARLCKWNQSQEWMGLFLDSRAAHKEGDGGADAEGAQCPLLSKPRPPTSAGEKGVHPLA